MARVRSPEEIHSSTLLYSSLLLGAAALFVIGATLELSCFAITGDHLTSRLRSHLMRALLRQEVGYFDLPQNEAGELTQLLSEKASLVHGLCGENLQVLMRVGVMVLVGLSLMFVFGSWQLSLFMLASLPLMILAIKLIIVVEAKGAANLTSQASKAVNSRSVGAILSEVVLGARTVASFTAEAAVYEGYAGYVRALRRKSYKMAIVSGCLNGLAQAMVYFVIGGMYLYGGWLLQVCWAHPGLGSHGIPELPSESERHVVAVAGGQSRPNHAHDGWQPCMRAGHVGNLHKVLHAIDCCDDALGWPWASCIGVHGWRYGERGGRNSLQAP